MEATVPRPLAGRGAIPLSSAGRSAARRFGALLGAFAVWEFAARVVDSALMPTLGVIVARLAGDAGSGLLWQHAQATLVRGFTGLGLGVVIGVALGMAMGLNRVVQSAVEPLLAATYPVPKLALYPFFILLFGFGTASKVALVALECLYPLTYNVYSGVSGLDRRYLWAAQNFGAGPVGRAGVLLRGALPALFAGLRIAVPIMLIVIVVTELIGESLGLGFLIRSASTNFEPEGALAVILFLGLLGFMLDRLLLRVAGLVVFWQRGIQG